MGNNASVRLVVKHALPGTSYVARDWHLRGGVYCVRWGGGGCTWLAFVRPAGVRALDALNGCE